MVKDMVVAPRKTGRRAVTIIDKQTGQEFTLTTDQPKTGDQVLIIRGGIIKIGRQTENGVKLRNGQMVKDPKDVVVIK